MCIKFQPAATRGARSVGGVGLVGGGGWRRARLFLGDLAKTRGGANAQRRLLACALLPTCNPSCVAIFHVLLESLCWGWPKEPVAALVRVAPEPAPLIMSLSVPKWGRGCLLLLLLNLV